MSLPLLNQQPARFPDALAGHRRSELRELRERSIWLMQLRWWVPPVMILAALLAHGVGLVFNVTATVVVAILIFLYNVGFWAASRRIKEGAGGEARATKRFIYWQLGLDYSAMFLLIHFTGGAASPVIFFFIFHIIFASILLPPLSAYGFSTLAVVGMVVIAASEYAGLIPHHALVYRSRSVDFHDQPFHMTIELGFFAATAFITAFSTTTVMKVLRERLSDLARSSTALGWFNDKFNALLSMVQTVGSIRELQKVLDTVVFELAAVMDVRAISVKLLSEDGKFLSYAASHGFSSEYVRDRLVEVAKSPLNRRIIEGEPFATGKVTEREMFQFGEDLAATFIQSVLFVPLTVEGRVIGILGAYCVLPDRFGHDDVEFFRLAAGVVAIGLDNARSYQAMENLMEERSKFMRRVAHNLRAPLAAVISMLELLREQHLGPFNEEQAEYLRRIDRRIRTMLSLINELMTLSTGRTVRQTGDRQELDVNWLAGRLQRTFQDEATEKGVAFSINVQGGLPPLWGNCSMVEQTLENLASNAIKYTRFGGNVDVSFCRECEGMIGIRVKDTGIGIPEESMPDLFTEFFRAPNAKDVEETGTGLGLAIVKEFVDLHRGRITVDSREGRGTTFTVLWPDVTKKGGNHENNAHP